MNDRLPPLTPYTFGSMSLGHDPAKFPDDVRVARHAMDLGLWVHSSRAYAGGKTFEVLKKAFDEAPAKRPRTMFKVSCESATELAADVEFTLTSLGLPKIEIAQLAGKTHQKRDIVADFLTQGPMYQTCSRLKEQGLVDRFVFEIFYSYSADALKAVQNDLFDGYIFYYSLLERQVSNEIWQLLWERQLPVLALRPVAGSFLTDSPKLRERRQTDPKHPAFQRLDELAPVLAASDCHDLLELSLRFLASHPNVVTAIAGTGSLAHLDQLESSVRTAKPLAPELVERIRTLHRTWCSQEATYQFAKELW
ncbi:MAG: aldo/keto reductase [Spirochaetales bacterium]